jgi:hypothetical protein
MRSILLFAFLPTVMVAAPALGIVRPVIAQSDGGDARCSQLPAWSRGDDVLLLQHFRLYQVARTSRLV